MQDLAPHPACAGNLCSPVALENRLMNRRRCSRSAWIGIALSIVLSSRLMAQVSSGIPKDAKTASDASPYKPVIDSFIKAQAAKLRDKSPVARRDAREALANESVLPGGDASASYISTYAGSIETALTPLAQDPNMRTRLNAAIVVARVAKSADNDQLKGAIEAFLKDKYDPVVLWAMNGARSILPYYLRNPANTPPALLNAIVQAVQTHRMSAVAQEAYDAVSLGMPDTAKAVTPAMLATVIPEMQSLLQARLNYYVQGVPDEPQSENRATKFFALQDVWKAQTPPQQMRSMQLMTELINVCQQRAASLNGDERKPFIETLSAGARAIQAIGLIIADPNIDATAKQLAQAIPSTPDTQISLRLGNLVGALQANPAFKGMANPSLRVKPVVTAAPATAPAPETPAGDDPPAAE